MSETPNEYTLRIFNSSWSVEADDHAIWTAELRKGEVLCTSEPFDSDGYEVCDSPVLGEIHFDLTDEHITGAIENLDTTGLEGALADFADEALGYYRELAAAGELEFKDA